MLGQHAYASRINAKLAGTGISQGVEVRTFATCETDMLISPSIH